MPKVIDYMTFPLTQRHISPEMQAAGVQPGDIVVVCRQPDGTYQGTIQPRIRQVTITVPAGWLHPKNPKGTAHAENQT